LLSQEASKYSREIARALLEEFRVRTVCAKFDGVKDILRKPSIRKILGNGTETTHRENGCLYRLDVTKVMFAKGNVLERGRLAHAVRPGETIVDMFAGIGYFSIPLAKTRRPAKIYAVELNPKAIKYLKENIKLNRVDSIRPIAGDCRKVEIPEKADRILMGYFPGTEQFLDKAFSLLKPEGWIHYHNIYPEAELWTKPLAELNAAAKKAGYRMTRHEERIVKQYAPGVFHAVVDCFARKSGQPVH
jgi:tRNA wybutosine-synthesizing protein 2